nr:hypothetical protein CFP56_48706 [Quercus suber]
MVTCAFRQIHQECSHKIPCYGSSIMSQQLPRVRETRCIVYTSCTKQLIDQLQVQRSAAVEVKFARTNSRVRPASGLALPVLLYSEGPEAASAHTVGSQLTNDIVRPSSRA